MRWNLWRVLLAVLIFCVFVFRLWLAFKTPYFSYDAYFNLRQVETVAETGRPLFQDPLSYQGRTYMFAPLFYYVLALFAKYSSVEMAAKVLPNLFFAIATGLVYLISWRLTGKEWVALIAAFFSAFIPGSYSQLVAVSPLSMALPLTLAVLFFALDLKKRQNVYAAVIFSVLLTFTHASSFLLILGFLFYFLLLLLLDYKDDPRDAEFAIFLFFLTCWFNLVIYKKVFLTQGLFFVWQNIPSAIRTEVFGQVSPLNALYAISFVPLLFGIYSIYRAISVPEYKQTFIFAGLAVGIFLLLAFKWIQVSTGLLFLGYFVVILSSDSIRALVDYLKNSRFPKITYAFLTALIAFFIITTLLPLLATANAHINNTPIPAQIAAFSWLRDHAPADSTVLSSVKEGQAIAYYTKKKNVMDTNFILVQNIDLRYADIISIFTTRFQTGALEKLNKYAVDYIYFSNETRKTYGELLFVDSTCFRRLFDKDVQIYAVVCRK